MSLLSSQRDNQPTKKHGAIVFKPSEYMNTSSSPPDTKEDYEMVAHVFTKLPSEYSELLTLVESMTTTLTLLDLKHKVRTFYARKLKDNKAGNEMALFASKQLKGICRKCGKQGHKASDCRSKENIPRKGIKCFCRHG